MTDITPALLAGIGKKLDENTKASLALQKTYQFTRWMKITIAMGVAMLVANATMLGLLIHLADTNGSTGDAIRSCTTPAGQCYQQGQKSQGQAVAAIVGQINAHTDLVFVVALRCSQGHPLSSPAFAACLHGEGIG